MKISNKTVLRTIFGAKGNFASNGSPKKILFDGIEVAPFLNNAAAATCISADFELNWAWRDLAPKDRDRKGRMGRQNIPVILDILDRHRIPITWATVGHLFLSECFATPSGLRHPDMIRPKKHENQEIDWYQHDPATDYKRDDLWYGPDLIKEIISRDVTHEVGTHSFSHIDFSENNRVLIERELEECAYVMSKFGITPKTLVFPYNIMGYEHLDTIWNQGITSVRHRDKCVRLSYPERVGPGIYKIYESMNLRHTSLYDYTKKAEIFLEIARKNHSVFHLWFHPSDPTDIFLSEFNSIAGIISTQRKQGNLWVATMADIASYCEARRTLSITSSYENKRLIIKARRDVDQSKFNVIPVTLLIPVPGKPAAVFYRGEGKQTILAQPNYLYSKDRKNLRINLPSTVDTIEIIFLVK